MHFQKKGMHVEAILSMVRDHVSTPPHSVLVNQRWSRSKCNRDDHIFLRYGLFSGGLQTETRAGEGWRARNAMYTPPRHLDHGSCRGNIAIQGELENGG